MRERKNETLAYVLLLIAYWMKKLILPMLILYLIIERSIDAMIKGSFIAFLVAIGVWMINLAYKHKIIDYMMEDSWE